MTDPLPPKVVFMGTPAFALPSLDALHTSAQVNLVGVFTKPPQPKGRGHHHQESPIHKRGKALNIPVWTPKKFTTDSVEALQHLKPDLIIVAAYGLILPKAVLDVPPLGCMNLHASLLPRWRGAAPIHRALLAGDTETGITLMRMDVGMDTGPMLATARCAITNKTTGLSLTQDMANLAAKLLETHLPQLLQGKAQETPQPTTGITIAKRLCNDENHLDWSLPADTLEKTVRTFYPKAFFSLRHPALPFGKRVRVLEATVLHRPKDLAENALQPGTFLDSEQAFVCQQGMLKPVIVQPEGKKAMDFQSFWRGHQAFFTSLPTSKV